MLCILCVEMDDTKNCKKQLSLQILVIVDITRLQSTDLSVTVLDRICEFSSTKQEMCGDQKQFVIEGVIGTDSPEDVLESTCMPFEKGL
mmetsp:Transcript_2265/g.3518  ORF Transcript_2265/g.3518 Transcript_2265/m.3518 type:complete len:89 (-) Transcript_2265:541-807(-)